ncbi:MAG: SUMF1/EgtB/PvdO family nonheme iron enzyme [Candidatus Eremiobacteraeota bacterium]|nr:SUMF1/EgtB/PvdO family nonheme iron enzyme [Candidatus Eremiobacteraeota bacterium]
MRKTSSFIIISAFFLIFFMFIFLGCTEKLKNTLINPVDGAKMILIPAGEFIMGANESDKDADESEKPRHKGHLDAFYIYKFEVTNRQFRKFVDDTGYKAEGNWEKWITPGTWDYPVIMVSWNDASAYCRWAGVKLPTEAQWEKAARGTDGRIYPWGNKWNPKLCNNKNTPKEIIRGKARMLYNKTGITPGGMFPDGKSPYGVMDMAGNVQEWCRDWFDEEYYKKSPKKNPGGPSRGTDKVLRGGSFYQEIETCRATYREDNFPEGNDTDYGFRCVWQPGTPFPSPSPVLVKKTEIPVRPSAKVMPVSSPLPTPDISKLKKIKKNQKDSAIMILIPGGKFTMGASPLDHDARWEEKPAHKVYLTPYYIYKYEVTFKQFAEFVKETGYKAEGEWKKYYNEKTKNSPVVYITWNDARGYCKWAGAKLPTEAQWEFAARGKDGRIYPWGNKWDKNICNNYELEDKSLKKKRYIIYDNMGITPAGTFPGDKSLFGVMDMGGNVIEWCRDWFDQHYYSKSPQINPGGPPTGSQRSMRGGGWGQPRQVCRSTYRDRERPPDVDGDFGFRCVVEVEGKNKNPSK